MTKIVAIANQKGGVAKTTSAVNLGASLVALGHSTLLVDFDPQGNATTALGVDKNSLGGLTIYEALMRDVSISQVRIITESKVDLLPSNSNLTAASVELLDARDRNTRLRTVLAEVAHQYEYILIDCPPTLGVLTLNALAAAECLLIPIQCEYFALEGLSDLLSTIAGVQSSINPNLQIEGLLRTLYDRRNGLSKAVSDQLETHFGDKLLKTIIMRNVRLAEAPSYGKPALLYDPHSAGAISYHDLAKEILSHA